MPSLHISLYHFILDDALDNAEARVGIYYCLHPKCWYWYSITDADDILDLGDNTVVGALKPVIELCSCEEASICSADIDRSTAIRCGAMWKVSWVHLGSRYKAVYNKSSLFHSQVWNHHDQYMLPHVWYNSFLAFPPSYHQPKSNHSSWRCHITITSVPLSSSQENNYDDVTQHNHTSLTLSFS